MNRTIKVAVYLTPPYVQECVIRYKRLTPYGTKCPYPGVVAELTHLLLQAMFVDYKLVFYDDPAIINTKFGEKNQTTGRWSG